MAQIEQLISSFVRKYIPQWYFPDVHLTDVLEVIILTFLIYQLLRWIKNTKAWMLLKGILVLAVFIFLAALFRMNTILFLARNSITVLATAAIVVFQPELRRALEKLGEKNFIPVVGAAEKTRAKEQEKIVDDIVDASFEMGKVKTGALIVIEGNTKLTEYEATGIPLDCLVSREVLINIFEHNTPLHDGAIIIRGNRITAATCYLPLSDNGALSKELGTRHRAAIGMSEVSDAMIIAVSEETGNVSIAHSGTIHRHLSPEEVRQEISSLHEVKPAKNVVVSWFKGGASDEK